MKNAWSKIKILMQDIQKVPVVTDILIFSLLVLFPNSISDCVLLGSPSIRFSGCRMKTSMQNWEHFRDSETSPGTEGLNPWPPSMYKLQVTLPAFSLPLSPSFKPLEVTRMFLLWSVIPPEFYRTFVVCHALGTTLDTQAQALPLMKSPLSGGTSTQT